MAREIPHPYKDKVHFTKTAGANNVHPDNRVSSYARRGGKRR